MASHNLFFGPIVDRFGRKRVLMWALGGYILGSALSVVASSFSLLLAARAFQGVTTAATRVAAIAIVRDQCSGRKMAESHVARHHHFYGGADPGAKLWSIGARSRRPGREYFLVLLLYGRGACLMVGMAPAGNFVARPTVNPCAPAPLHRHTCNSSETERRLVTQWRRRLCFGALFSYISSSEQLFLETFDLGTSPFRLRFAAIAASLGRSDLD